MKKLLVIVAASLLIGCNQRDANSGPAPENEVKPYPPAPDSITKYTDSTNERDSGTYDADSER